MIPAGDKIEKTYRINDSRSPVAVATLASDFEKFSLMGYAILGAYSRKTSGYS